jgi:hypothetical protein
MYDSIINKKHKRMFKAISNIDFYDLNIDYCSKDLGLQYLPESIQSKKGIGWRILSLAKYAVIYSLNVKKKKETIPTGARLFFALAQNEVQSMLPIQKKLKDGYFWNNEVYKNGYPIGAIHRGALKYIPYVFLSYIFCENKYLKNAYRYRFDGFCLAIESKIKLRNALLKLRPKQIVIANELPVYHRALAEVAFDMGIETVFMQHASFGENQPLLKKYNVAMLDGEDALKKYLKSNSINIKFYLIGNPKFDEYALKVKDTIKEIKNVGICTNNFDSVIIYRSLVRYLKKIFPKIDFYLRAHPTDKQRSKWIKMTKELDIIFSDAKNENPFTFLGKMDLIIAGDSNIHLEATLLNIPSIYFDPKLLKLDHYGFLKNGLVKYAISEQDVSRFIREFKQDVVPVRTKAKYYSDTVQTKYDGKSALLATCILLNKKIDEIFSKEILINNCELYKIKE